jgi:hypothetical protein
MIENNTAERSISNKKYSLIANMVLLVWFFLDMIGVYFDTGYLVTRSWKDDGVYFLFSLIAFLFYVFKENIGKYLLSAWLFLWLVTQFFSHEWVTITGGGANKIKYFEGALKWAVSETTYIPDVYHIILHFLILSAFLTTVIYLIRLRKKRI